MSGICAATICDLVLVLSPLGAVESTNCNLSGTARRAKPRMSAVPLPSPESIAHASTRTARATAACRHLLVLTRMALLRLDRTAQLQPGVNRAVRLAGPSSWRLGLSPARRHLHGVRGSARFGRTTDRGRVRGR